MYKNIFEIRLGLPGLLAISPRPRGGDWLEVDISALAAQHLDVLVSLLEPAEASELGLEDEAACCAASGFEFLSLPVPDLGTPLDSLGFTRVAANLAGLLREGRRIAIHCRQSVGRSGLLAVSIAVAAGVSLDNAIEAVCAARGVRV